MEPKLDRPTIKDQQDQLKKLAEDLELAKSMSLQDEVEKITMKMVELQTQFTPTNLEKSQQYEKALSLLFKFISANKNAFGGAASRRFKEPFEGPDKIEGLNLEDFASFLRKRFAPAFGSNTDFMDQESGMGFPAGKYVSFANSGIVIRFPDPNIVSMNFFEVWKVHDPQIVVRVQEKHKL